MTVPRQRCSTCGSRLLFANGKPICIRIGCPTGHNRTAPPSTPRPDKTKGSA